MKPKWIAFLMLVVVSGVIALGHSNTAQQSINMVGVVEDVRFGPSGDHLINAPNGHISFQKNADGYRIWVPGRFPITPTPTSTPTPSPSVHEEGGFVFDVTNWPSPGPSPDLPTPPTFVLGHVVDENNPDCGPYIFDRNYKALNAVIPGASPNTLLGFYDAEYHADCASEPLLSSIGIAKSTDGGISWDEDGQIIKGLDQAILGVDVVIAKQLAAADPSPAASPQIIDCGASGPSAVVGNDGYIYLYYADRTPLTGRPDSIYVARAAVTTDGQPLNWQKWVGEVWGAVGDQKTAVPILEPSASAKIALQPHVSWNTSLNEWLMVFKTAIDFEVATSVDGVHWNPSVPLLQFDPNDKDTGFPTLISTDEGETSQRVTGTNVWLYYSSLPKPPPSPTPSVTPTATSIDFHHYHGHFVQFTISDATPPVTTASIAGPLGLNGWYTGPTTVSFMATDDLSGVARTEYSLDNGATWTTGSSVSLDASAIYNLLYRSIDEDGNVEAAQSLTVMLDSTPLRLPRVRILHRSSITWVWLR